MRRFLVGGDLKVFVPFWDMRCCLELRNKTNVLGIEGEFVAKNLNICLTKTRNGFLAWVVPDFVSNFVNWVQKNP